MIKASSLSRNNGGSMKSKFFKGFNNGGYSPGNNNSTSKRSTFVVRIGVVFIVAAAISWFSYLLAVPSIPFSSSSLSSSILFSNRPSSSLVLLPMQPYHNCWGGITKTVCNVTYLIENLDIIPMPQANGDESLTLVCDYLWNHGGTSDIAHAPVCLQNSNTLAMIATYDDFMDKNLQKQRRVKPRGRGKSKSPPNYKLSSELQIIEQHDDPLVKDFLANALPQKTVVRKILLNYIDFPTVYRGVDDTNNWLWEKGRDANYGNMVWRYASTRMLNPATTEVDLDDTWFNSSYKQQQKQRSSKISTLVIASANTLHVTDEPQLEDLISNITERVRFRNVPTVVIGIGIQIEFNDDTKNYSLNRTDLALTHQFQRDFLQEVSAHQKVPGIGVRGDLTKTICVNSGIKNCISMGCPSLTISRDINLGETLLDNWSKVVRKLAAGATDLRIAVTFPAYGGSDSSYTAVEFICTVLEQFGKQITVILQDTQDKGRMEAFVTNNWRKIKPSSKLKTSDIQYEEYYNVESWLAGARKKYDLCLSSRIHGSMVFINNGIPAVVIPTDFRIFELLHSMKIPHILPEQLAEIMKKSGATYNKLIMAVMDKATNTNFFEFERNRRAKIQGWKNILDQVGLEMDPSLLRVIRTPLE